MTLMPVNVDKDVYFRENIERRVAILISLSDSELRIYEKNWYFGYHKKGATWPVTNFTNTYPPMPEFKGDPVMQKLKPLYVAFGEYKDNMPLSDKNKFIRKQIEDSSISLSRLATQMGNRDMKEDIYMTLLEDTHPSLKKAYDLVDRLQKDFPNIEVRP